MEDPEEFTKNPLSIRDTANFFPKIFSLMDWKSKEVVLDYGCGPGRTGFEHILPVVEKYDSQLVSVDCSKKEVEFGKKHFPHERITYEVGDVLGDFPFENESFDKIVSIYVFHFMKDMNQALKGLRDALKPGGQLGFATFMAHMLYFRMFKILLESPDWGEYYKECEDFFPEWSVCEHNDYEKFISDLFIANGFKIKGLKIEPNSIELEFEKGLDVFLSVTPNLRVPPTQVNKLRKDYRHLIAKLLMIPVNSTHFTLNYDIVIGVVEKV